MLNPEAFFKELTKLGYNFYSGVPCSFIGGLINFLINKKKFIMASSEGEATSICAGANLCNKKSVLLIQNSGLTNAMSPLTSLIDPYKIPIFGFIGLRGDPKINDEPQHQLIGKNTKKFLKLLNIKYLILSKDIRIAKKQLIKANNYINKNQSFFFLVRNNTFEHEKLNYVPTFKIKKKFFSKKKIKNLFLKRFEVLNLLISLKLKNTLLVCTTGKSSRELHDLSNDSSSNFYMVGSMGYASSIGLGISLNTKKKVIVIDGDGALLMKMGNLTTNAFYAPKNLFHLVIDNESHDSTGGQFTLSPNIDFVNLAASCNYQKSIQLFSLYDLKKALQHWYKNPQLIFAHIKVLPGSLKKLGRPRLLPSEYKKRVIQYLIE